MRATVTEGPRWLDQEQQQTWQDLLTIVIGLPALLDRQLTQEAGVSNFEYGVLARLSLAEAHTMRLSDLAGRCNSTLPRLSKTMVRFEQNGWVSRRPDPVNGRYTLATLTAQGRQKVEDNAPRHVEQVRRLIFEPLTLIQQQHLRAAMARIAGPIRRELDGR